MNRAALLSAFARLVASWALLSLVGYFFGHDLISLLIPALTVISESISADFSTILAWSRDDPHMLTVTATSMNPLASAGRSAIGMGSQMTAGTNLEHILVPVVILYAAIAAWPVINLKERLAGLLLGILRRSCACVDHAVPAGGKDRDALPDPWQRHITAACRAVFF